jgi:hypothetical protein
MTEPRATPERGPLLTMAETQAAILKRLEESRRTDRDDYELRLGSRFEVEAVLRALRNAASERGTGIPEGWKLVPIEPTEKMLDAAEREWDGRMSVRSTGVWQAMCDAVAPQTVCIGDVRFIDAPSASARPSDDAVRWAKVVLLHRDAATALEIVAAEELVRLSDRSASNGTR